VAGDSAGGNLVLSTLLALFNEKFFLEEMSYFSADENMPLPTKNKFSHEIE